MNNILDYIDWRGDLGFGNSPFNEVDNLILSQLVYIDFSEVINDGETRTVTLSEAAKLLDEKHPEGIVPRGLMKCEEMNELLEKAGASQRFGAIELFCPESRIDTQNHEQFYAITFILGDGSMYVAFRGTDQTIVGWQEDFNMGFICPIPSQLDAAEYLSKISSLRSENIITGGHSKGGNLAVYSAAFAKDVPADRVLCIYSNDGPGFPEEIVHSDEYNAVLPKVRLIIPQGSIVGMLLEHKADYDIVKSMQKGISQHDGFSWEVLGTEFIKLNSRDKGSIIIDSTISKWIAALSEEDRRVFVESLFEIISLSGAQTLEELPGDAVKLFKGLKTLSPSTKEGLTRALKALTEQAKLSAKQFYIKSRDYKFRSTPLRLRQNAERP